MTDGHEEKFALITISFQSYPLVSQPSAAVGTSVLLQN